MTVTAKVKFIHIAPRKVRLVCDAIRGLNVVEAADQLKFMSKQAASVVLKALNSAIANAEHNRQLEKNNLYISKIMADEGPKFKRWQPRAFGRAYPVLKRSSHITIVLKEKIKGKEVRKAKEEEFEELKAKKTGKQNLFKKGKEKSVKPKTGFFQRYKEKKTKRKLQEGDLRKNMFFRRKGIS